MEVLNTIFPVAISTIIDELANVGIWIIFENSILWYDKGKNLIECGHIHSCSNRNFYDPCFHANLLSKLHFETVPAFVTGFRQVHSSSMYQGTLHILFNTSQLWTVLPKMQCIANCVPAMGTLIMHDDRLFLFASRSIYIWHDDGRCFDQLECVSNPSFPSNPHQYSSCGHSLWIFLDTGIFGIWDVENRWRRRGKLPILREGFAVINVSRNLYLIGGRESVLSELHNCESILIYNIDTGKWNCRLVGKALGSCTLIDDSWASALLSSDL
jgi:hypothetical protein